MTEPVLPVLRGGGRGSGLAGVGAGVVGARPPLVWILSPARGRTSSLRQVRFPLAPVRCGPVLPVLPVFSCVRDRDPKGGDVLVSVLLARRYSDESIK